MNIFESLLEVGNKRYFGRKLSSDYNWTGSISLIVLFLISLYNGISLSFLVSNSIQLSGKNILINFFLTFIFTAILIISFLSISVNNSSRIFKNNIFNYFTCYILLAFSSFYEYITLISNSTTISIVHMFDIFRDFNNSIYGFLILFLLQLIIYLSLFNYRRNSLILSEKNYELKKTNHNLQVLIEARIKDQRESFKAIYSEKQKSIEEQLRILSSIHHELGNTLPALKQDINNLVEFVEYQNHVNPGFGSKIIAQPLPGEDEADITTIDQLVIRMNKKISYAISTIVSLGSLIKANPSSFQSKYVNVNEYLKTEVSKFKTIQKNVQTFIKGDSNLEMKIDPTQFSFLVQNFLSNALRHGDFTESSKDYFVLFEYSIVEENFILEIINNGSELDNENSIEKFLEPFNHFGTTGNTGLGGYLIGIIVRNHGGTIKIIDKSKFNPEYKVCFQITIPTKI